MAVIEYDGTDYLGFQLQAEGRTIQGEVERVLTEVTRRETRVVGAGRTDAGVHAAGQVISIVPQWKHSLPELQRAMNALLPEDIAVHQMVWVADDFHPRFSAVSREYRYAILNQPFRSPLARRFAYHYLKPLDVEAMAKAAKCLVGSHDFTSFGRPPQGENAVRRVYRAECTRQDQFIYFDIVANAFLYRMVRNIAGTLLLVGMGKLSPEGFEEILQVRDRRRAGPAAPAHGLCLMKVNY
ncbi:MAG: tRNA pseudouridine(38-40) synthase TruA [Anaerolineales bacterium]|nr:MAG: tRNA pseudouridine(38-40) synthase TruA [Anaerolineales bacterium]